MFFVSIEFVDKIFWLQSSNVERGPRTAAVAASSNASKPILGRAKKGRKISSKKKVDKWWLSVNFVGQIGLGYGSFTRAKFDKQKTQASTTYLGSLGIGPTNRVVPIRINELPVSATRWQI